MISWGISWPISKLLVTDVPPLVVGFFRFLFASLLFVPTLLFVNKDISIDRQKITWFAILGLIGIFGYGILFLIGMTLTTASQGSIIAGVNPAGISLIAHIVHRERLDAKWKYGGFIISFFGVIFVIGMQALFDFQIEKLLGSLIILAAMGCWGLYSSIGKSAMIRYSSLEVTTGAIIFGTIFFGIGAIKDEFWNLAIFNNADFWLGIVILSVFTTFIGFFLYFYSIKNIGATQSSIYINLVPVFGTIFSFILLNENIDWTLVVGFLLISAGIIIINYPNSRSKKFNIQGKNSKEGMLHIK